MMTAGAGRFNLELWVSQEVASTFASWFFGSLHGILGVSDEGLKSLSECCRNSLVTIDVHGCVKIKVWVSFLYEMKF
jgi:hypothetical protein